MSGQFSEIVIVLQNADYVTRPTNENDTGYRDVVITDCGKKYGRQTVRPPSCLRF